MDSLLSVLSATLLVVGAILVLARLVRGRVNPGVTSGTSHGSASAVELRVVRRIGIGPRQGVAVVEADGRRLLLSCGDGGVRLLQDLGIPAGAPSAARHATSLSPEAVAGQVDAGTVPALWHRQGFPRSGGITALHPALTRWVRRVLPLAGVILALGLAPATESLAGIAGSVGGGVTLEAQQGGTPGSVDDTPGTGSLPEMDLRLGSRGDEGGLQVTGPVGAVLLIGFMTLIPTLLLLMTSFTRILIVLHLLKQALGAQAAPPAHVLTSLALLLTLFVMAPTLSVANRDAVGPWMNGQMDEIEMLQTASVPFREFMMATARDEDLALFIDLWGEPVDEALEELPLVVVTSAFVTSELRAAFQMGFALFLPFVVIDLVVASVLMSMGMFMLPPLMVSLPFKLLLFVLVDGWGLVVGSLVQSFR
jgi:flagellar biosynthesis protein FliP